MSQSPERRRVRFIVGIFSANGLAGRREACMATWMTDFPRHPEMDYVFVLGDPSRREAHRDGNLLYLPCPDDYASLPQKTRAFCAWALANYEFDYLFKCDDDTYVCLDRLAVYPLGHHYVGNDIGGYASGGGGYLLDTAAASVVAEYMTEPQGWEDHSAGDRLREHKIEFTPDSRFGTFSYWDQIPLPMNTMITGHGWRENAMRRIHGGIQMRFGAVIDVAVSYGALGLCGDLGYTVDGSNRVRPPRSQAEWRSFELLSAHAPSRVGIRSSYPIRVVGFMDRASRDFASQPTRFVIDGNPFAELAHPGQHSHAIILAAGDHVLETMCPKDNTRRYPVWAVRSELSAPMPIVMPTSNAYVELAEISIDLLDRYWPSHPAIELICYEQPVNVVRRADVRAISVGKQSDIQWTTGLRMYLQSHSADELILLMLDDYGLCAPPNLPRLQKAISIVRADNRVSSFRLTGMRLPTQTPYNADPEIVVSPPSTYSVHVQAAIWRREHLLQLLTAVGNVDAATFELHASNYYNTRQAGRELHLGFAGSPETPLFLDSDPEKHHWALPYHNLVHAGKLDVRHADFLEAEAHDTIIGAHRSRIANASNPRA